MGPYSNHPFSNFIVSPLGVVPKRETNAFRLIHDLSYTSGFSIYDHIPLDTYSDSLELFDDVVNLVLQCGSNSLIAKADIEEAFRIIPISPLDYHKVGFSFKNQFSLTGCYLWGHLRQYKYLNLFQQLFSGFCRTNAKSNMYLIFRRLYLRW